MISKGRQKLSPFFSQNSPLFAVTILLSYWNWGGAKDGFESVMSNKMLIIKAGIDFSSTRRALQHLLSSYRRECAWFSQSPPLPPSPRIHTSTVLISYKESILWNQRLGSYKFWPSVTGYIMLGLLKQKRATVYENACVGGGGGGWLAVRVLSTFLYRKLVISFQKGNIYEILNIFR